MLGGTPVYQVCQICRLVYRLLGEKCERCHVRLFGAVVWGRRYAKQGLMKYWNLKRAEHECLMTL